VTAFLGALAERLAERWMSLLVLPGLLLVGTGAAGALLGQRHWDDWPALSRWTSDYAARPAAHAPGAVVLAAAAVLLAAAAVGFFAQALGRVIRTVWIGEWPAALAWAARPLVRDRRRRWDARNARHERALEAKLDRRLRESTGPEPRSESESELGPGPGQQELEPADVPDTAALLLRRNSVALVPPERPTWIGDRLRAVDRRILSAYDLDLAAAWPRLELVLPPEVRAATDAGQDRFAAAARLGGWGLLYLAVGIWWWPSAIAGALICATSWRRGRATADALCWLIESAVDLHGATLAQALGVANASRGLTRAVGRESTRRMRKDS
jgi:hypothetical protein